MDTIVDNKLSRDRYLSDVRGPRRALGLTLGVTGSIALPFGRNTNRVAAEPSVDRRG